MNRVLQPYHGGVTIEKAHDVRKLRACVCGGDHARAHDRWRSPDPHLGRYLFATRQAGRDPFGQRPGVQAERC